MIRRVLSAAVLLVWASPCFPYGGVATSTAVGVVQTLTLVSTSGTVSANTPSPPMFGLQLPSCTADAVHCIATGTYPQLQATDGTPWPATFFNRSSWSDGSIRHISVLPGAFPKAIPTTGVTANVLSGGSAPAASGLTVAGLYAENIVANTDGFSGALGTGLGLQGNWSAKLANDANNAEVVDYGDGGGGRVWRILTHVQSGGTAHGQMEVYWYVQQLLNASGGLAGYRVLPRLTQPWYDIDSPAKDWRGLQDFNIQANGGTPIVPPFPYQTVAYPSADFAFGNAVPTAPPVGWNTCASECVVPGYLTTTGTLPTGIAANTVVCVTKHDFAAYNTFGTCDPNAPLTISGNGTGTHTFHPIPLLPHFGTLWGAQENGRYTYIQGAGTVATDAPIIIKRDPVALVATRVYPPFDMTLSPTPDPNPLMNAVCCANATTLFDIMRIGPLATGMLAVGDRNDIGVLTAWQAKHFYNQTTTDDIYVRMLGLISSLFASSVRDQATLGNLNLGDPGSSYTGMPASLATTFEWGYGGNAGFTLPTHGTSQLFFSTNNYSHFPHLTGYAYLVTGEPQYLDLEFEQANQAIFARSTGRNAVFSATTYYATVMTDDGWAFRDSAWSMREINYASVLAPDTDPAGTQVKQYFSDIRDSNLLVPALILAEQNSYTQGIGLWMPPGGVRQEYMMGYMNLVLGQVAAAAESSGALGILQDINALYYNHLYTLTGDSYSTVSYATYAYDTGIIAGPGSLPFFSATLTWSAGTATITGSLPNGINGMKVLVSGAGGTYNGTFPITIVTPNAVWTYALASDPGGSSSCGCEAVGTLISDDAHLALDFLMEAGPADGVGPAFWTQWSSGTPGTFSKLYVDYSPTNGAGGAVWHPANGDKIIFPPFNSTGNNDPQPGGLAYGVPYYQVNTHFGSLSALSWASTAGGTLTATTTSPHGLSAGTYNIGINGTAPAGYEWSYVCTVAGNASQFTCATALGDFGTVTYPGTFNTFNLSATLGGSPISITDSGLINDNFKSGMLPASAPAAWLGTDFPNFPSTYPALMTGGVNYMQAVGVTGISTMQADLLARFNAMIAYFGYTRGTFFQTNPKWAIGGSF